MNPRYVFFLLLSCACGSKRGATVEGQLHSYFSPLCPPNQPGLSVLIRRHDSILLEKSYGLADMQTREPVTSSTLFNLGSISKTFVANAILILREQGKLSLSDSLIRYFPEFRNKPIAASVRIRHLLTHTSGLPDTRKVAADTVFYLTAKDEENWYPVTQTDTLVSEPGSRYEYSNPAFNGLALIIEQVSGMRWQSFIEANILRPSGMAASTITDGPHPASGVSHGYQFVKGNWIEDDYGEEPTFAASGNGGVWSGTRELALYYKALRNSAFLPSHVISESQSVQQPANWSDDDPAFIGWSWFIGTDKRGRKTVYHTGTQGGFHCLFYTIPEDDFLLILLANSPRPVLEYKDRIMEILEPAP
jgi:CubicO group peptidase (beta-lactamase class C family)